MGIFRRCEPNDPSKVNSILLEISRNCALWRQKTLYFEEASKNKINAVIVLSDGIPKNVVGDPTAKYENTQQEPRGTLGL
jgi:hypothetical protein